MQARLDGRAEESLYHPPGSNADQVPGSSGDKSHTDNKDPGRPSAAVAVQLRRSTADLTSPKSIYDTSWRHPRP
ncbi:hypothetical protein CC2G_008508 [Coprinopsis cinerea AmutBmut pab1-1]|nr:hypothetical protein CC2G_008508 [Coprinopsis cinerea AmutBmut pab1-1]